MTEKTAVDARVHPTRAIERFRSFALTPSGSAHLDLIRGLAAWAVMWGHLRGLFFVDFPHIERHGVWFGAIYFLTGFGHQAVMVFFVLSGFFISSAILKRHASQNWSWRDYAIDRSSRLYVVLIPGLLFGLLWDTIGSHRFASTGLYTHPIVDLGYAVASAGLTFKDFVGNICFLQTIVCRTFGSNAPLWSLANEFWYYVLFPVALSAGLAWASKRWRRAILLTSSRNCRGGLRGAKHTDRISGLDGGLRGGYRLFTIQIGQERLVDRLPCGIAHRACTLPD